MNAIASDALQSPDSSCKQSASAIAPRPRTVAETGLSLGLLCDLVEKHLFEGGVLTLASLVRRCGLAGGLIEELLNFMRQEGRIEVRSRSAEEQGLRYGLTDRGRQSAMDSLAKSGYIGPAPVPLDQYLAVVASQTVRARKVTRPEIEELFSGVVVPPGMLERLGPSMNSGKAIFVYGHAGTGKTYLTQKLTGLMSDTVLVPHSISVGDTIIQVFDPSLHRPVAPVEPGLMLEDGHDPRYVACCRPVVITGGELGPEMLEVQYDPATRQYRAPLQLKATNGVFILDDLGRQRVAPEVVLNRWIVPMEERKDYLSLATGQHFCVLFDVVLIFSTNLDPLQLADEAFLRRIGYKLRFDPLQPKQYQAIWEQVCAQHGVAHDPSLSDYLINEFHARYQVPLLPCHPRDLIGIALDRVTFLGEHLALSKESLEWAWENYFVRLDG
ncbi:MAG: AAA family ATPase [Steroidobacteraceae bacterium]